MSNEGSKTDLCFCGHIRGHHNTYQGNVYYLQHTRCQFKPCGCPRFVLKDDDA